MGGSRWSAEDWSTYKAVGKSKKIEEVFNRNNIWPDFDPKNITLRESRDSDAHPNSTPIIVGLDVTGSMGVIADKMRSEALGVLVNAILDRKPIPDPQIMFMGIGDCAARDVSPLQVSQFESDITMVKDLERIWLEGGGGGNQFESYHLPWYFASMYTSTDSFEKRGKKGYLFTIGDEEAPPSLSREQIISVFGDKAVQAPDMYTSEQLLNMVSKMYHVYHIVVENGFYAKRHLQSVMNSWNALLGQRVLRLDSTENLAEIIVSAIQINEGESSSMVINSWGDKKAKSISHAVKDLVPYNGAGSSGKGVVKF